MSAHYSEPEYKKTAFNCPFCDAYAQFRWSEVVADNFKSFLESYRTAYCCHCNEWTLWRVTREIVGKGVAAEETGTLIHPKIFSKPLPSSDMPKDCKTDYMEARSVFNDSPRAAAALLRLVVQKLCVHFGESGENINDDIKNLVKKGLDGRVQRLLDIVRITGNNAVHPGELDLQDNPEIAGKLFEFVNMIVDLMITKPKEIERIYGKMPEKDLENIEKRDGGIGK